MAKQKYVALHTIQDYDPDLGATTVKPGKIVTLEEGHKDTVHLLKSRAIRKATAQESGEKEAPLVPNLDNDSIVGDTSDHSGEVAGEGLGTAPDNGDGSVGTPDNTEGGDGDGFGDEPAPAADAKAEVKQPAAKTKKK